MNSVKLNYAGFTAIRRSPQVVNAVNEAAQELAQKATSLATIRGAKYSYSPAQQSKYGVIALVTATHAQGSPKTKATGKAVADEAHFATLEKAVGGC